MRKSKHTCRDRKGCTAENLGLVEAARDDDIMGRATARAKELSERVARLMSRRGPSREARPIIGDGLNLLRGWQDLKMELFQQQAEASEVEV